MAGTVAAVFGDSIFDLLELDTQRLSILSREAERQRWLRAMMERRAHYDKKFNNNFQHMMKVHGEYTEDFHRKELDRLKSKFGGK